MKYSSDIIFIRTKCDNAIRGIQSNEFEEENKSRDEIFDYLKTTFADYMTNEVSVSGKKLGKFDI